MTVFETLETHWEKARLLRNTFQVAVAGAGGEFFCQGHLQFEAGNLLRYGTQPIPPNTV